MDAVGVTQPDGDPVQQKLLAESQRQLSVEPLDRERAIEAFAAITFVVVATAIAVLAEPSQSLDLPLAGLLVGLYALSTRVEFRIASGWTDPSQLIFVPMLFLLPTSAVPLLVALALLVARLPDYADRSVHAARALLRIADAWYSVWPVLVLIGFDATILDWGDWPIYLLALAAQFACDAITTTGRVSYGLGVPRRTVLAELSAIYRVDALLAPAGLLAAYGAVGTPETILLLAPLLGVFVIFAREREARIESAITLSSAYRGTALLLSEVLTSTDEYTGHHSRSVVVVAHQVAQALGLDEGTMRDIEFGALLHDVGKISVPSEILNKPAKLSDEEMELMRRHTVEGEEMLGRIGGVLEQAGIVVRSHHERYDGSGYPDGLAGAQIPIAARVISACDAFSAMTTDRPYRRAMPIQDAIAELRRESGRQFDPRVVDRLIEVVEAWEAESDRPRPVAP